MDTPTMTAAHQTAPAYGSTEEIAATAVQYGITPEQVAAHREGDAELRRLTREVKATCDRAAEHLHAAATCLADLARLGLDGKTGGVTINVSRCAAALAQINDAATMLKSARGSGAWII